MKCSFRGGRSLSALWPTLLTAAIIVGCQGDPVPPPSVSGNWEGLDGTRLVLLSLTDEEGSVSGSGTIANPAGTIFVSGTREDRALLLTLNVNYGGAFSSALAEGELRGGKIEVAVIGSALTSDTLSLSRK